MTEKSPTSQTDSRAAGNYDPAAAVPEEYDVLCDGCGYSLVGLQSDKCPECGHAFDPTQLPFARVPWLHRRRIGRAKAYFATVRFVLRRPRHFASELLRPVRISIDDARSFRRTCINLVLLSYLFCVLEMGGLVVANYFREAARATQPLYMPLVWYLSAAAFIAVTILIGLRQMLYMMTDLPVFIWKGHPSLRASELSPIQCYAAAGLAPLLVAPVLLPLAAFCVLLIDSPTNAVLPSILLLVGGMLLIAFVYRMLMTPLRLMIGSGVQRRRVKFMLLYLPFHWLMMTFLCVVFTLIAVAAECGVIHAMDPGLSALPPSPEPQLPAVISVIYAPLQLGPPTTMSTTTTTQPAVSADSSKDLR